jgi:hypothetical protein
MRSINDCLQQVYIFLIVSQILKQIFDQLLHQISLLNIQYNIKKILNGWTVVKTIWSSYDPYWALDLTQLAYRDYVFSGIYFKLFI